MALLAEQFAIEPLHQEHSLLKRAFSPLSLVLSSSRAAGEAKIGSFKLEPKFRANVYSLRVLKAKQVVEQAILGRFSRAAVYTMCTMFKYSLKTLRRPVKLNL